MRDIMEIVCEAREKTRTPLENQNLFTEMLFAELGKMKSALPFYCFCLILYSQTPPKPSTEERRTNSWIASPVTSVILHWLTTL